MKPLRLQTADLFSYQSLDIRLDDLGLCLLEGSNGAGKSSILKSLSWCLFDNPLSDQRADEVIRCDHQTDKPIAGNTFAEVVLDNDGDRVVVARYRKHHQHKDRCILKVNGHDITGSSNRDTQQKIEEILRLDFPTFSNCVLFGQDFSGFASNTDAAQKAILERLLSAGRFAEAQARKKARLAQLERDAQRARDNIAHLQQQVGNGRQSLERLKQQQHEFEETKRIEISRATAEISRLKENPPVVDETLDEQIEALSEETKKIKKAHLVSTQAETAVSNCRKRWGEIQGRVQSLGQQRCKITDQPPPEPEFPSEHYAQQISAIEKDVLRAETKVTEQRQVADKAIRQIQLRNETTDCRYCGQKLSEEAKEHLFGSHADELETAEGEIELAQDLLTKHRGALESTQRCCDEAVQYENWQEDHKHNSDIDNSISELKQQQTGIEAEIAKLEDVLARARQIVSEALQAQEALRDLSQRRDAQRDAQAAYGRDLAIAEESLQRVTKQTSPYTALIATERDRLTQLQGRFERRHGYLSLFERAIPYQEYWVTGFGNAGVKSLLLDTCVPFLNKRAGEYLEVLVGDGARVEFGTQTRLKDGSLREKFQVAVSYQQGAKSRKGISGGELRRADIPIMLALGDLAASRAMAPVGIRLLDEPFDGLDAEGKERVVDLLNRVVAPRVGTLLVISHDEDLKAMFSRRVRVEKIGGISQIAT